MTLSNDVAYGRSTPELDRLWLLDRLWSCDESLSAFTRPTMGMALNAHDPPSGRAAIPTIAAAAYRDGLVAFRWGEHPRIPLSIDEIHRWFHDSAATSTFVTLTGAGCDLWEAEFEVRWSEFVDISFDGQSLAGRGLDRDRVVAHIERAVGPCAERIEWRELVPWSPTDWKVLPRGVEGRVQLEESPNFTNPTPPLPRWKNEPYIGVAHQARVDLADAPGWTCEPGLPVERLRGAKVLQVFTSQVFWGYRDPDRALQLRLELGDGGDGLLELDDCRASHWSVVEAHATVGTCRIRQIAVSDGVVEVALEWGPSQPRFPPPERLCAPAAGVRWWRNERPVSGSAVPPRAR